MSKQIKLMNMNSAGLSIKRREILKNVELSIYEDDYIGIYGLNGSGKSLLSELISGNLTLDAGVRNIKSGLKVAVVSSAERKRMLAEDRYNDDSEFMEGKIDPGRSVIDILESASDGKSSSLEIECYANLFGIEQLFKRGIKFLSTGEFRKMMFTAVLVSKPDILILDDPYTGLDIETRKNLEDQISEIRKNVKALIIASGRFEDLLNTERNFLLDEGFLREYESLNEIKEELSGRQKKIELEGDEVRLSVKEPVELIRFAGVNMSFYEDKILHDINWTVTSGEHWQISGVNGSGKSSLLSLVNGDSPKAYGQQIYLFGRKRGTGETIWEIKQKIGWVSGSLQRQHLISQNVFSVVVSGFFDSIGLYEKPDPVQLEEAKAWCSEFGLEDLLDKPFNRLSEGMKRAVLIIRAIVKKPEVLILDEPCQGLDDYNSEFVLSVTRQVISRNHSTLLYVSHDPFYRMSEITNILKLEPCSAGGYTAVIEAV